MDILRQEFSVPFSYEVHFTRELFRSDNLTLSNVLEKGKKNTPVKVLIIVDAGVLTKQPSLYDHMISYANTHSNIMMLCQNPIIIPSGEGIKNDPQFLESVYRQIHECGLCRLSYILVIGGGALLDMVGYAAATSHRGIRLIRIPTTVLSQADSGVGVKNSINYFSKKNFLGTFAPPYAVINDFDYLETLEDRDWLSGIAEAVKVSLIKDEKFFNFIHDNAIQLSQQRNMKLMEKLVVRCAELHMNHIGRGGDPFEMGSSRPLDFGHWAAHKLEQLTHHRLRHGEAVAIGLALDITYSHLKGFLSQVEWEKILQTLQRLNFCLYVPELSQHAENPDHPASIFKGLVEFQEHLGGELTIMMLEKIGKGIEIHNVDIHLFQEAIRFLEKYDVEATTFLQEKYIS